MVLLGVLAPAVVALYLHVIVLVLWRNKHAAVVLRLPLQDDFPILVHWQEALADWAFQVPSVHERMIAVHVHLVSTRQHDSSVNSLRQISETNDAVLPRRNTPVVVERAEAKARVAPVAVPRLFF